MKDLDTQGHTPHENHSSTRNIYIDLNLSIGHLELARAKRVVALVRVRVKGALCAQVTRLRVCYTQTDETLSRNSLRCLSKAKLPIAVN